MIFGLGFLLATLAALLIVPALNARAERLARRRIEALFPLSISELTAEKDHLRAEFAVLQRRIEIKVEAAQAAKQDVMGHLGRRIAEVEALSAESAARAQRIETLETEFAAAKTGFEAATAELASLRAQFEATSQTLSALEDVHRTTTVELAADRVRLEASLSELGHLQADLTTTRDTLSERETSLADLRARHKQALAEIDGQKVALADVENRLAAMTLRANELDRSLTERRAELAAERQRSAEMARSLVAEQDRGVALESRNRALEAERGRRTEAVAASAAALSEAQAARDAALEEVRARQAEIEAAHIEFAQARARIEALERREESRDREHATVTRRLEENVEVLKAEKAAIEGALAAARKERSRSEAELKALRRAADGPGEPVRAENAELRRRIDELAETLLALGEAGELPEQPAPPRESIRRERRTARA